MADREAMRKFVEQAYADRDGGHIDGLMTAFHADAVFELMGEKTVLPLAGAVRSHPNVREAMTGFIGTFQFIKREIISFIADGDRAAVHSRLTVRLLPKGEPFTTEITDLFKFQDGKIVELVEFADTALIKEMTAGA